MKPGEGEARDYQYLFAVKLLGVVSTSIQLPIHLKHKEEANASRAGFL